jgi:hypothetical protein
MSAVNWNVFEQLSGSVRDNFEALCRGLIRRHYGSLGQFGALANQPGVEFHLKVHTTCALGKPGRWYGWQCRWYDLPKSALLGSARRAKIEGAISTSERILPGLTDWVLWTRHPLTKGDQKWFDKLKTKMRLHQWTAADVEDLLSGEGLIFRGTYFGELILTSESLAILHEMSVAPIRPRWLPEAHQPVDAERELRRMLGEAESWSELLKVADGLVESASSIEADLSSLAGAVASTASDCAKVARTFAGVLREVHTLLAKGDLDLLRQQLESYPNGPSRELISLPRQLRAARHPAALTTTNVVADVRLSLRLLDEVNGSVGTRLIGVIADAGGGKTQLAAQLTAPQDGRCAGVLLFGQNLHAGQNLGNLANTVLIPGNTAPVSSMEALVAAVDAAGQRARRRLPIVIDGLNEAEIPRDWKAPLASLHEFLHRYPYVLIICTVRTGSRRSPEQDHFRAAPETSTPRAAFADIALPDGIQRLEIPDFGEDTDKAIERYFRHYRINAEDTDLPREFLSHPLTLRLFCEVTNPKREREVGIEAMPGSLTALFDRYLEQAATRIVGLAPPNLFYEQDVHDAYFEIGVALWTSHSRELNQRELQKKLREEPGRWHESLVRALEQEGIILRIPGKTPGDTHVMAVYDALAGHLVARVVLSQCGRDELGAWLRDSKTVAALTGPPNELHPLASDIFDALVGLAPRIHHLQLWPLLDEPLRGAALRSAARLEGAHLDAETVTSLAKVIVQWQEGASNLLVRLCSTRTGIRHPLNAKFLDAALRRMSMPDRDRHWSEWVRRNRDYFLGEQRWLCDYWRHTKDRVPADRLRARWIMWALTSTIRKLRDRATHALYWFGRGDPAGLFDMTIGALPINDPYVPERMLAASYGTAMALHADHSNNEFTEKILPAFARELYTQMFAEDAPHSTTHALMRDSARHTIEIALLHAPKLLNATERKRIRPPFRDGGIREWGKEKDRNEGQYRDGNAPLGGDFENYTLGRLVPERRNYQREHGGYQEALQNIRWRIYNLGYTLEAFGDIDKRIASDYYSPRISENSGRVDRYGKKYSWIAYYELYGLHYDKGLLKGMYSDRGERPSDIDCDPSFPETHASKEICILDWLEDRNLSLSDWIERGGRPDIKPHLLVDKLNDVQGPWVLLDGFVIQVDKQHKRAVFIWPRGLLVAKHSSRTLRRLLETHTPRVPEIPEDGFTLAGEIPWCENFPANGMTELEVPVGKRLKKVSRPELQVYRSGKRLNVEESTAFFEQLRTLQTKRNWKSSMLKLLKAEGLELRQGKKWQEVAELITERIPVLLPVRENKWEGEHGEENAGRNVMVPTREIAQMFKLSIRLPDCSLQDSTGNMASVYSKTGDLWGDGHSLCYLRKDLMDKFLKRNRMELIWVFSGMREMRLKSEEYHDPKTKFEHYRKRFQCVYRYNGGKITAGKATESYD